MADQTAYAELSLSATGHGDVVIDGQSLGKLVHRLLLTAQAGEPPRLVLELSPHAFQIDAEGTRVGVSPVGEQVLTQLGWRPPVDGPPSPACSPECQQELDRLGLSWDALKADRDALAELSGEVLAKFTQHGHPGRPALSTGWVWTSTVDGWRARLAELTRASPGDAPSS